MSTLRPHDRWRELAVRENGGLSVSLLWHSATNRVKVAIVDVQLDERFEIGVAGADALAAFYHPFAYAPPEASLGGVRPHAFERSIVR